MGTGLGGTSRSAVLDMPEPVPTGGSAGGGRSADLLEGEVASSPVPSSLITALGIVAVGFVREDRLDELGDVAGAHVSPAAANERLEVGLQLEQVA